MGGEHHGGQVQEILGFGLSFQLSVPRGAKIGAWVLIIDQVGQVLWSIYKLSNYTSKGSLYKICSQESEVMGM